MPTLSRISPCLWFNDQAEEAAAFYIGIFPNSHIRQVTRYGDVGREHHGKPPGSVMTVEFELDGHPFTGLNGGPLFRFSEAISFQISCDTQAEVDHFWDKLSVEGDPSAQQCGWLKDKFGVSWQVVPKVLLEIMSSGDADHSNRAMQAILQMRKIEIATLLAAVNNQ